MCKKYVEMDSAEACNIIQLCKFLAYQAKKNKVLIFWASAL